jgi:hypothetical protein
MMMSAELNWGLHGMGDACEPGEEKIKLWCGHGTNHRGFPVGAKEKKLASIMMGLMSLLSLSLIAVQ